jgi:hypothetical protein
VHGWERGREGGGERERDREGERVIKEESERECLAKKNFAFGNLWDQHKKAVSPSNLKLS